MLCQQNYILWKYVVTIRGIMGNIIGKNDYNKLKTNLLYTSKPFSLTWTSPPPTLDAGDDKTEIKAEEPTA